MNLELFIAQRMRLDDSSDGSRRAGTGTAIAVTGIAVSFIVMLLSVVVMLGFKNEIKAKITGFDSQVIVYPPAESVSGLTGATIDYTADLQNLITKTLPEAHASLTIASPVIFKTPDDFQGMIIRGIDTKTGDAFIENNLVEGKMPSLSPDSTDSQLVIPRIMARRLLLGVGDKVQAFFVNGGNVKARNMTVTGIYDTSFGDYDKIYAFARTDFLQHVNGLKSNQGSTVAIDNLGDDAAIDEATSRLEAAIYEAAATETGAMPLYQLRNIHSTGAAYFSWLALLDTNVIVILALMAIVSGFTLVSSLFIIILERVNMIGILKALGMSTRGVVKIFMYVAERLVIRGLIIGNLISAALIFVQSRWHLIPLDPESYYLSFVPVKFDLLSWGLLNLGVIIMAALVLIAPARVLAGIKPTTAIRYE